MSLQELPGFFGVMFPAFSLPMKAERSRNKERLEASLAGLCELELLKQRQECRVLSALRLGDAPASGRPPWGALRAARCALDAPNCNASGECGPDLQTGSVQCTPWPIKSSLEQRVAQMKVNAEVKSAEPPTDLEDMRLSSGEFPVSRKNGHPESNNHPVAQSAPEGTGETETRESWHSDTTRRVTHTDAFVEMRDADPSQKDYRSYKVETYMFGLIQRRALPSRTSKPRTSPAHETRAVTVARQSSLCRKEEQHSPKQLSAQLIATLPHCSEGTALQACQSPEHELYLGREFKEDTLIPYHHLVQSAQHPPGFYHKPRKASMVNTSRSTSPDYPSRCVLQPHQDSSNSETDSPHFHNYNPLPAQTKSKYTPSTDEQLVNAEYIPAQPCRASARAFAHHQSSPHEGSGVPKPSRSAFSPERSHHHEQQQPAASQIQPSRCRGGLKKCRMTEDRSSASRKAGKKACRSQSENSLQRVPERKPNTVERDGGGSGSGGRGSRSSQSRSKKQQQGSGSGRRWQSTLELSQDETEQPPVQVPGQSSSASNQREHCARRTRKSRMTHASYAYPHRNPQSHQHQHMEYNLERDQVPLCKPSEDYPHQVQGESESSMSEADSPDSSSLSSDSEESGGLVWPQQVPPQLSIPSLPARSGAPLQPKAFVKIKASHALKKKILRFRTGSLKVMTTV